MEDVGLLHWHRYPSYHFLELADGALIFIFANMPPRKPSKSSDNSWHVPFLDFSEKLVGQIGKLAEKPESAAIIASASALIGPWSAALLIPALLLVRFKSQWNKEKSSSTKSARIQKALDDQLRAARTMEKGDFKGIDRLLAAGIDDTALPLLILCRDLRKNGGKLDGLRETITLAEVSLRSIRAEIGNNQIRTSKELSEAFTALQRNLQIETSNLPKALRPSFARLEKSLAGSLGELREMQDEDLKLSRKVARKLGVHEGADEFEESDLLSYARRIEDEFEEPEILRVRPALEGRRISLSKLFIEPLLRQLVRPDPSALEMPSEEFFAFLRELKNTKEKNLEKKYELAKASYQKHEPVAACDTIRKWDSRGILLFAGAGGGKSAFLRVIALRWAREFQKKSARNTNIPVPILVELRRYATARAGDHRLTLLRFISESNECLARLPEPAVRSALQNGTARLYLDGLDEVPKGEARRKILGEIHEHLDQGHYCLITSRIFGFEPVKWCERSDTRGYHMLTLTKEQQDLFIETAASQMEPGKDAAARIVTRVRKRLESLPHAEEMAANPLLLTLILLVHSSQAGVETRADLYEQASALLIDAWEDKRLENSRPNLPQGIEILQKKTKIRILHHLAWQRLTHPAKDGENLFSLSDVRVAIDAGGSNLPEQTREHHKDEFPVELRNRHYVLCFRGGDKYSFVHRTFLEYFAALHLAWLAQTGKLNADTIYRDYVWPHLGDERWQQTLRLYLSIAAEPDIPGLHDLLLAEPFEATDAPLTLDMLMKGGYRPLLLSAEAFLDTRQEARSTALAEKIAKCIEEHFVLINESHDLSDGENLTLFLKVAFPNFKLVTALVRIHSFLGDATQWLDRSSRLAGLSWVMTMAVPELPQVFGPDPALKQLLLESIRDTRDFNLLRSMALTFLCSTFSSDIEVYEVLRTMVLDVREDSTLRQIAIQEVGRRFNPDAELLGTVREIAIADDSSASLLKTAAAGALKTWKKEIAHR